MTIKNTSLKMTKSKVMNNQIIVTGGCGYIGSHTVVELLANGFEPIIVDDLSNSQIETISRIEKITGKKVVFENIDLKDESATQKLFKKYKDTKGVIHFAAYKAVGESIQKPLMYYNNNLKSMINVLQAMEVQGINNFIFSSSATVYGEAEKLPVTEKTSTFRPFSAYGNTKKIGEEILEEMSSNSSIRTICLRYFNPIGAHSSGFLGELPQGTPNNLLPFVTQTAIGKIKQLQVFGNDYPTKDGTAIRDYIHVEDLATAHVKSIKRLVNNENDTSYEIYNLGTGIGYSVMDIINTFEKVNKVKINYTIAARRKGDTTALYADATLAKEKLDWVATRDLEKMLRSSWIWEQNIK